MQFLSFLHINYFLSLYTAAPLIVTPSGTIVEVDISANYTLSCVSEGSPPDTFTWQKDDDPTVLQSTSITAVDHTSTRAVFRAEYRIDSVTLSNNGTYTCTVANPIGSDSANITIEAIGMYVFVKYIYHPCTNLFLHNNFVFYIYIRIYQNSIIPYTYVRNRKFGMVFYLVQ